MDPIFATVINELEDFVLVMKVEGNTFRYVIANNSALERGNMYEHYYGKTIDEAISKERATLLKGKYFQAIHTKKRVLIANELELKNGNMLGKPTVTPVFDNGVCTHIVIIAHDITAIKESKEKLHTANTMLDSFINSSGDGIIIMDSNKTVTRVNRAYTEIYGYSEEDLLGYSLDKWVDKRFLPEFLEIFNKVNKGEEIRDHNTQRARKDGSLIDLSITYSPYRNLKGEIIGVIGSIRDISESKRIEVDLRTSNDRYKLLTENMLDIIGVIDINGIVIYASPSYKLILDYDQEHFLGKSVFDFIHPSDRASVNNKVQDMITTKSTERIEFRYQHRDLSFIWIEVLCTPILNANDMVDHFVITARDITSRKLTEIELWESKEKYSLITKNTSDLIKNIDLDGSILFASPSHQPMLGYSPKELEGKSIYDFIHSDDHEKVRENTKQVISSNNTSLCQIRMKTAQGKWIIVESIVNPIIDETGKIQSILGVSRNITDRLKNEELIRNLDRLSIIGQLAAGVAHEIRNPLTALKGFSKILQSTLTNSEQNRYLHIMLDELDRIELIVNEFMTLAKPQAIEFKESNIQDLIRGTVTILETQAVLHNVQIVTEFAKATIFINSQPNQIKQVFMNFIKNAIEAMQSDGVIMVTIGLKDTNPNLVSVKVKDEGIGIEEDRLQYLGTPFYTTKEKGIGLGLTISNKIIKEHNGEMHISSQIGKGTTVEVLLPISRISREKIEMNETIVKKV